MRRRNWLVEDNIVALYIALHKYKDMKHRLKEVRKIIPHKGFPMRIQQFIAIKTKGKRGLKAGLNSPLFREIYRIFRRLKQKNFAKLVNSILYVKSKVNKVYL